MICVGCSRQCRRTCSNGGHGWCSYCADAAGRLECSRCRQQKSAKRQQSKQSAQQSRAAIAAANAPVYVPSWTPPTPQSIPAQYQATPSLARKALYAMNETELEQWVTDTRDRLEAMIQRNEAYTHRRQARGTYTPTDQAIERDNRMAQDMREALTELVILWRMAHSGVSIGSAGPATGMLIDYDDKRGKVTP